MVYFLPSDVARLVLGYLKEHKFSKTYTCFLKECPHLKEYYELLVSGSFEASPFGLSLLVILEEWWQYRQQGSQKTALESRSSRPNNKKNTRKSPDSRQQRKSPAPRSVTKSPSPIVIDSLDDTDDSSPESDEIILRKKTQKSFVNLTDRESSEDDVYFKRKTIPFENSKQVLRSQNKQSPLKSCLSKSPGKSGHIHFKETSNISLPQSLRIFSSKPSDRPKYPNIVTLLSLNSSSKKKASTDKPSRSDSEQVIEPIEIPSNDFQDTESIGSTPELVEEETEGAVQEENTLCDPNTTDSIVDSAKHSDPIDATPLQKDSASSKSSPSQSANNSERLKSLHVLNKEPIQPLHKTPHKSTKSPQTMVNMVTPVKLFQDGDTDGSTRSPRRKKPKTPRKRNSDVSPSGSVKESKTTTEDKLPLFQQVLSDRRLHEKLAETCNIVSGQLKLSLSGSSANGEKSRIIITPPRSSENEELEHATTSRSLEEILDLDTNYASELLSENIDMSDPAFECLFKLFGTDKESFSESIRKENQKAEKETEKLTKDLEELERSITEEFGPNAHHADLHSDPESHMSASQQFSQPSSPYISQAVCPSPFVAGDRMNQCINSNGTGHFTSLLRGHELGSSPAQSTPSRKSNYSSGQYIGSPASVTTQPFSPYNAPSPCSLHSPRSNVPETPRSQLSTGTPNSPVTIETAGTSGVYNLHQTPSGRNSASTGFSQSTPHHSSQSLPMHCSPLVTSEIHAGSPIMAQRDVPNTPQAKKRIFNVVDNMHKVNLVNGCSQVDSNINQSGSDDPLLTSNNKISSQVIHLYGDTTVLYQSNESVSSVNVTLTNENILQDNLQTSEANYSQNGHPNIVSADKDVQPQNSESDHSISINKENMTALIQNVEYTNTETAPCTTIVNTIGCISLPCPSATDLSASPEEKKDGKKKRSTRSDKGKKRKKPQQGNESKSSEAEVPVLKDLLSKPTLPGLTLNIPEPTTLTAENFQDQQLVMLSPGGQNTIAVPILSCVDAISNSSAPFDTSVVIESELDQSACVSLQPENQTTQALVKSIESGNTAEILNQARDIVKDCEDKKKVNARGKEEKKRIVPKIIKKRDERHNKKEQKLVKQRSQAVVVQNTGDLNPGPDEILYATPLHLTIGKKYVRTLDFDKKLREIQPKPPFSNLTVVAKTICMPNSSEHFSVNSLGGKNKLGNSGNSVVKSTASLSDKSASSGKQNSNGVSTDKVLTTEKPDSSIKITEISTPENKAQGKNQMDGSLKSICDQVQINQTSSNTAERSRKNLANPSVEMDKESIQDKSADEKELSDKDIDRVPERRCTRSSKPATMERLNDKGMPETISNDSESKSNSSSSSSMGHKQFRRKPKTGKDMRMIIKHLKSVEDEDDVFSTFSDNSVDSTICDQATTLDRESENPIGGHESGVETARTDKDDADLIRHCGITDNKKGEISKSIPKSLSSDTGKFDKITNDCKSDHIKEDKMYSSTQQVSQKIKDKQKKVNVSASKNNVCKGTESKRPSPKLSSSETQKKAKAIIIESESSDEDIPLSHLRVNTSASKSDNKKSISVKHKKLYSDNRELVSEKHEKDSDESRDSITPTKSPVERTSPSDLLTPSKEIWMEHVGLTPTKQAKTLLQSPLSENKICRTPNTRSKFRSPLKSPIVKIASAKKLFQNSPNGKTKHTEVIEKKFTKARVDLIIKTLHDNNPESSLVNKVSPKSYEEKSSKNRKSDKGTENTRNKSSNSENKQLKPSFKLIKTQKSIDKNSERKVRSIKDHRESNKDNTQRKNVEMKEDIKEKGTTDKSDTKSAEKSDLNKKTSETLNSYHEDTTSSNKGNSRKKDLQLQYDEKPTVLSSSSKYDSDKSKHSSKTEESPQSDTHTYSEEKIVDKNSGNKRTEKSNEKKNQSGIKDKHSDKNRSQINQNKTNSLIKGPESIIYNKILEIRSSDGKSKSYKEIKSSNEIIAQKKTKTVESENASRKINILNIDSKTKDKTESKRSNHISKNEKISREIETKEKNVSKIKRSPKTDIVLSKVNSEKKKVLNDTVPNLNEVTETGFETVENTDEVSEDNNDSTETDAATDFLVRELQTDTDQVQTNEVSNYHTNFSGVNECHNGNFDLNTADPTDKSDNNNTLLAHSECVNKTCDHKNKELRVDSTCVPNSDNFLSACELPQVNETGNNFRKSHSDLNIKNSHQIEEISQRKGTDERKNQEKEINMKSKLSEHALRTGDDQMQGENTATESFQITKTTLNVTDEGNNENGIETNAVTPSSSVSVEQSNTSSHHHHHHHHRHSSGKKRKKKSKKRHREESIEGENEHEPKKKKRKHDKHKDKHRRKHKKSSKLSSIDVEAALSQIYSSDTTPAESPIKMTGKNDTSADCPYRTPLPNGHLPSMFGHPLSNKDRPLQQSTPIVNSNLARIGAFGTLFSPVSDGSSVN